MATRKIVKTKRVSKTVAVPATETKTISTGKPVETFIDVMGITFEQGTDYKFGKCRRAPRQYHDHDLTVYKFILDSESDNYIIWGRNQADRYVDVFNSSPKNFAKQWVIVDWDSLVTTGGIAPVDDDDYDEDEDDY